jgi:hypothetical protein
VVSLRTHQSAVTAPLALCDSDSIEPEQVEDAIVAASVLPKDGRHRDAILSVPVDSTAVEWNYNHKQLRLGKKLFRTGSAGYRILRRQIMILDRSRWTVTFWMRDLEDLCV